MLVSLTWSEAMVLIWFYHVTCLRRSKAAIKASMPCASPSLSSSEVWKKCKRCWTSIAMGFWAPQNSRHVSETGLVKHDYDRVRNIEWSHQKKCMLLHKLHICWYLIYSNMERMLIKQLVFELWDMLHERPLDSILFVSLRQPWCFQHFEFRASSGGCMR